MPKRAARFLAALAAVAALACAAPVAAQTRPTGTIETMPWQLIERIISGNVIDVRGVGLVRLAGIEDAGELSRAFLAGIISSQPVRVVPTAYSSDGLTHALVYTPDGRCVNAEMLRFGYARVSDTPGFDRIAEFKGLQEDAQRLKRGLWGMPAAASEPSARRPSPPRDDEPMQRFYLGAGGGSTLDGDRRDWIASFETGLAVTRAFGFYFSGGYIHDLGDAGGEGAERAWHGSVGMRLTAPLRAPVRPYVRAGGGYMRIHPEGEGFAERNEPFWEAGAGILVVAGPAQLDAGYTFARIERIDVTRVFALLGIRF